ncbi:MAG: serine/threonine-protein kinase [Myxococcota bacterium]
MVEHVRPESPFDGRYEIEGFLRPGRYGDLWAARRAPDGGAVALKLLKPELFKDGEAIRRFQREVRLLLAFEHPYLLRVLDHGTTTGGDPYVVLERREGRLLSDLVARGPLPLVRVRTIGAQIARVLAAAAARGIVHRGLCPDAILLVGETDEVKVLDFGLAIVFRAEGEPRLTEHGQRLGDPVYMAPEYIQEFRSDGKSDLYALGILLYELATGDPPFRGRPMDVLDAHVSTTPAAPSAAVGSALDRATSGAEPVPAWFDGLVLALLDKDPERRPDATGVARSLVAAQWPPPSDVTGPFAT